MTVHLMPYGLLHSLSMSSPRFIPLTNSIPGAIQEAVRVTDSAFADDAVTTALNGGHPDERGSSEGIDYWTPYVTGSVNEQEAYALLDGDMVAALLVKTTRSPFQCHVSRPCARLASAPAVDASTSPGI